MDGTHPMYNSQLAYGCIKKGKDKFVKADTGRQRVNIHENIEEYCPELEGLITENFQLFPA